MEFYTELRYFMTKAADKPESFFQLANAISRERIAAAPLSLPVRFVAAQS
jgi:hypothetical protein